MKTITGQTVRKCYSRIGTPVANYAEAVARVGFNVLAEPVARHSTGLSIPNSTGLFRSDNGVCLGIHSDRFSFVQPSESLRVLEKAREIVGGQWVSVQANKGGRMVTGFVDVETNIKAPKRGDTVSLSLAYFDHFDGGGRACFKLSACNLTCDNGMTGQKDVMSFNEKHIGDISGRMLAVEAKLQFNFALAVENMREQIVKLDSTPMDRAEVEGFARVLFPAKDENEVSTKTENMRDAIVTGFSRGTGNQGRTRWDAFNSVTEFLDWGSSFRETDFSREENRFESLLTGNGAKTRERALELLLN